MRLTCRLREARGKRTLAELARASGVHGATLSRIERGQMLPSDEDVPAIEAAYGAPRQRWYSDLANLAIQEDEAA